MRPAFASLISIVLLAVTVQTDTAKATGSLRVTIKPEEAIDAGAKWRIGSGPWQTSGETIKNLSPGNHTVSFKKLEGWKKPKSKTIAVVSGEVASIKGKYKLQEQQPAPIAVASPNAGPAPLDIQFTGDINDPDAQAVTYSWDFGDSNASLDQNPTHTYAIGTSPGTYSVVLHVEDADGGIRETTIPITITSGEVEASALVEPGDEAEITVSDSESEIAQATVSIPAGAVSAPIVVTIGEDTTTPSEWLGRQPLVELGPEGTQFEEPIEVVVPIPDNVPDPALARVIAYDSTIGHWTREGISGVEYLGGPDRLLRFYTTHFTYFSLIDTWSVTDLGSLGGNNSYAFAINNASKVTGYSYVFVSANWRHAYLWDSINGMGNIHDTTFKHSYGFAISDANPPHIAGYLEPEGNISEFAAFVWDSDDGTQNLGTLGGNSSQAWGVNDAGTVVGQSVNATGETRAFYWTNGGGMIDLGTLGGDHSYAFAINNADTVVGCADDNQANRQYSFRWTSGNGMEKLKQFGSARYSCAFAVNASGVVVGEAEITSGPIHAALWRGTNQVDDLGTLGGNASIARAINVNEEVVGASLTADGNTRAFGWDDTGVAAMTDLNDLLPSGSGWVLIDAWDINDNGEIVGYGTRNGFTCAFLLKKI